MAKFFISDIHLDPKRSATYQKFIRYLRSIAAEAEELYILGDLFEYWIGDDAVSLLGHETAVNALKQLSECGVRIFVMHGNRDFLIGEQFVSSFDGTLLDAEHTLQIGSNSVLLLHGDSLCTDDVEHQRFRDIVLSKEWQQAFLSLNLQHRVARAQELRELSENSKAKKKLEIMDVNLDAVSEVMQQNNTNILIHGHVHKRGIHQVELNGEKGVRYVLGDWDSNKDGVIRVDSAGEFELFCPSDYSNC